MNEKKASLAFKALADENRIRILLQLRAGETCACKLLEELPVTQPTLSHHMKILCDAGIVAGRKEGKWMYYSISQTGVKTMERYLRMIATRIGTEEKQLCGKEQDA